MRVAQTVILIATILLFRWYLQTLPRPERDQGQRGGGTDPVTWLLAHRRARARRRRARASRGSRRAAPVVLVAAAIVTSLVALVHAVLPTSSPVLEGYVRGDVTAQLFTPVVNIIFLGISVYVRGRVAERRPRRSRTSVGSCAGAAVPRRLEPRADRRTTCS